MGYLIRVFHLTYAPAWIRFFKEEEEVHPYRYVAAFDWGVCLDKATSAHNERFRVGVRPSSDCGLRPFGVAHGVGRCEIKVVGGHFCRWSCRVIGGVVVTCGQNCTPPAGFESFRKAVFAVMNDLGTDARS